MNTKNLYVVDEVVSSLHKSIRRGIIDQAIFWAGELYNSGYEFFLYKKLFTIAIEDIGLASPDLILYIYPLYMSNNVHNCIKIIKLLVNAKKNRMIPDLTVYITTIRIPVYTKPLDFNKFIVKYPNLSNYIIERVKLEPNNGGCTDIFSALIQFAKAIKKRNFENACFFAHLLNLTPSYHKHFIIKLDSLDKCSIIIWGILINKSGYLQELGVKINTNHIKLFKKLVTLVSKGLVNNVYALLFAISIIFYCLEDNWYRSDIILNSVLIDNVNNLSPEEIQLFNNDTGTGTQRRKFWIPEYALDVTTKRGRGKVVSVPAVEQWSLREISKSHQLTSSKNKGIRFQLCEGNKLYNEYGPNNYKLIAEKILLDTESKKNYTFTKYTKLVRYIIPDIIKVQSNWIVLPNYYLKCNPLKFDGTLIHDTDLYEHEIFCDITRYPNTKLYSAKLNYPNGFCQLPVMVYGPISDKELDTYNYINNLKKIFNNLTTDNYHILKVIPTLNEQCDSAKLFLIIQTPINIKQVVEKDLNITNFYLIKSYILIGLFHQLIKNIQLECQPMSDFTIFYLNKNELISYGPEIQTSDETGNLIIDFIREYKHEFLSVLKEWYQKFPNDKLINVYNKLKNY
jgi:hypothetical protein